MNLFTNKTIKFVTVLIAVIFLIGCEKKFDNLIDNSSHNYQVESVSPKDSIIFNVIDSSLVISIQFYSTSKLNSVYALIIDPAGKNYSSEKIFLFDNGKLENGDLLANDKKFSNKIFMKSRDLTGRYTIKYYVNDDLLANRFAAQTTFVFRNGVSNIAPVISNAFIDPDTLVVTTTTTIQTRVRTFDENGLNDIKEVYFIVYRPDGTTNNIKTLLFDDGNVNDNGDLIAGDGVFSRKIQVNENNVKGTYRFEFRASDRGGLLSNIINYPVLIQ